MIENPPIALPDRSRFLVRVFFLFAVFLNGLFVCGAFARAESTQSGNVQNSGPSSLSVLDGMSFSGELNGPGIVPGTKDVVVFRDGMFLSKECQERCGYTDGPYWVRSDGEGVHFKAETPCLKSDATIVWTGIVKGDEIEGSLTWTSERWYWTIEKQFSFKGTLTDSDISVTE